MAPYSRNSAFQDLHKRTFKSLAPKAVTVKTLLSQTYDRYSMSSRTHMKIFVLQNVRECMLWLAVEHSSKDALELFAREIAPAGTGMGMLPSLLFP